MQARYYDPVIGRFYSNDPVGSLQHLYGSNGIHGFNRYAYANNNPYKYTDPNGESSLAINGARMMFVPVPGARVVGGIMLASAAVIALNEMSNDSSDSGPADPNVDSGNEPDPADKSGKLTKSGRALQKHGSRPGSAFPPATGNADDKNQQGQGVLEDIVNDPDATSSEGNRFGGTDVTSSDGRGARFDQEGKFRGFLEPKQDDKQQ